MRYVGQKQKPVRLRAVFITAFGIVATVGIIFQGLLMLMAVPSESMRPAIETGNLLIGVRNPGEISRGDVLVFHGQGTVMIKRLIGLPGELVCIGEDGSVTVDGSLLEEPYVQNQREGKPQEFQVPAGYLLFLGDNRTGSFDARYWDDPYIPLEAVVAKAEYVLFPRISKI